MPTRIPSAAIGGWSSRRAARDVKWCLACARGGVKGGGVVAGSDVERGLAGPLRAGDGQRVDALASFVADLATNGGLPERQCVGPRAGRQCQIARYDDRRRERYDVGVGAAL